MCESIDQTEKKNMKQPQNERATSENKTRKPPREDLTQTRKNKTTSTAAAKNASARGTNVRFQMRPPHRVPVRAYFLLMTALESK